MIKDTNMAGGIRLRKFTIPCFVLVIFVVVYIAVTAYLKTDLQFDAVPPRFQRIFQNWEPYTTEKFHTQDWLQSQCLHNKAVSKLEELPTLLEDWKTSENAECRDLLRHFASIFSVTKNEGEVVISKTFEVKVRKWLGNVDELFEEAKKQTVILILNEYTGEQNSYNPIRSKRPLSVPIEPEEEYVNRISKETEKDCDFCNYSKYTAEDVFGRIESTHSFSAANTFKLDTWHSLFMLKTHHPHHWTQDQYLDLMNTTQKWFNKVHDIDKTYRYPALIWDLLPHAGASQVHPHIHGFIDRDRYQGAMENWRKASINYNKDYPGRSFFTDLVQSHAVLGLTVQYGQAVALANLVPKKENEVLIISEKADKDFFQLIYFVVRAYIDDMKKLCFSSGISFPSMTGEETQSSLPAIARFVTRGAVADIRSDISSLELFTAVNGNTDPYDVIRYVKASVMKRSRPNQ